MSPSTPDAGMVFGTFAADEAQLQGALVLAESVRSFGGGVAGAPIWVYVPEGLQISDATVIARFVELNVELKRTSTPPEAERFYYAGKVFAAARAEAEAEAKAGLLVWMDEDTVVLSEPAAFRLDPDRCFAYRPVMHNIIGSLWAEPPNEFWSRIYSVLEIPDDLLFAMTTPADRQEIRAYFNAGLLVVRPARGILRSWAEHFKLLYEDSVLVAWAEEDHLKKIFLHQTALVGAALKSAGREEMVELPPQYNYPLFFKEMFGAVEEFDSVADVVTLRYDVYFRNPAPDWHTRLKGPAERIAWLKEHLARD